MRSFTLTEASRTAALDAVHQRRDNPKDTQEEQIVWNTLYRTIQVQRQSFFLSEDQRERLMRALMGINNGDRIWEEITRQESPDPISPNP